MKSRRTFVMALAFVAVIVAGAVFCGFSEERGAVRSFEFTSLTKIPALPEGTKRSRIWIPIPQSDAYQEISDLKIASPFPYALHQESEYGNRYVYLEVLAREPVRAAEVNIRFHVVRHEHQVALGARTIAAKAAIDSRDLRRFLQPDRRVPVQGMIGELSAQETRGIQEPVAKARAVYNYVIATMRYDKSGTGWGNGDAVWACTAKRGNCTDFHSLFIGMARAAGIPARFEIGFSLPENEHAGTISGYHCWAQFYVEPYGWIPVDASEAWKHPEKKNYFFGAHEANRVQFSVGRDIRLNPPQEGEPLNYFVYPYAELDGKPLALESKFSFQDGRAAASER